MREIAPAAHAVEAAAGELGALGALDGSGRISERGRRIFNLPLDAPLGRLLVEADAADALEDMVDLVSALSVGRRLFVGPPGDERA